MGKQTITLAEPMLRYVDGRIAAGQNSSLSEYVSDLIAQDIVRQEANVSALRNLLISAEESGISERSAEEIFKLARSRRRTPAGEI